MSCHSLSDNQFLVGLEYMFNDLADKKGKHEVKQDVHLA